MSLITEHIQPVLDRKLPAAFVGAMLLIGAPAHAGDSFFAERIEWTDATADENYITREYVDALKVALAEAFAADVRARMIAENGDNPEDAVVIKEHSGSYRVISLHPEIGILELTPQGAVQRAGQGLSPLLKTLKDVRVARCEVDVDPVRGERVLNVWRVSLLETKNGEKLWSGPTYHVAYIVPTETLMGQTWTRGEKTRAGKLIEIAYDLDKFCRTRDEKSLVDLDAQLNAFEKK